MRVALGRWASLAKTGHGPVGCAPGPKLASGWLGRGVLLGRAGHGPGGVCVCVFLRKTQRNYSRIKKHRHIITEMFSKLPRIR